MCAMKTNHLSRACSIAGLILLTAFISTTAFAQGTLDQREIRTAVETWVREWTPHAKPDAVIQSFEPYVKEGETRAYIARLSGGGYCLCGADPLVLPVYLYCPEGTYDPRNPSCRYVLDEISGRTKYLRNALSRNAPEVRSIRGGLSQRARDWSALASGRAPAARSNGRGTPDPVKLELELTCKWDQPSPYNDQCPNLSPGYDEHVYAGCNTIAVAQLMYYWQWPSQGSGSHTWHYDYRWRTIGSWDTEPLSIDPAIPPNWPKDQIGTTKYARLRYDYVNKRLEMTGYWDESLYTAAQNLCTNSSYLIALANLYNRLSPNTYYDTVYPGSSFYDWSLMEDKHSDPVDPGDQEAAELINHIGNTIVSGWGIAGTGSNFIYSDSALETYFHYDPDTLAQPRDANAMISDIQWLRACGLGGGNSGGGGHAWVVHGYDAGYPNTRFLMNMGWGGASDGWYTLDNLPGGFHLNQDNLLQVAPVNVRFVGSAAYGDGSPDSPYKNIQDAIAKVADHSTLIFKACLVDTSVSSTLVINKPLTLKGYDVTIE
jgi:hypothetical protein